MRPSLIISAIHISPCACYRKFNIIEQSLHLVNTRLFRDTGIKEYFKYRPEIIRSEGIVPFGVDTVDDHQLHIGVHAQHMHPHTGVLKCSILRFHCPEQALGAAGLRK